MLLDQDANMIRGVTGRGDRDNVSGLGQRPAGVWLVIDV
jgi:hypothetical protein